jgi:hypothetical protein
MDEDTRPRCFDRTSKVEETEEKEKERLLIRPTLCYEIGGSKETKGGSATLAVTAGKVLVDSIAQGMCSCGKQ